MAIKTKLMSTAVWYHAITALYEKWCGDVLDEIQSLIESNVETLFIEGRSVWYSPKPDSLWAAYANYIKEYVESQGFCCELVSGVENGEITPPSMEIKLSQTERRDFAEYKAFIKAGKVVFEKGESA